ncbi:Nicotianamine synthase [Bimuria novae-zelandiae CBS 107.79]|uniref:Nicotianamine synthase n=1 Tax=Bimuria novae-zelandiae CBS 107.79 TaxID=1447943 RepID=A0A6A5UTM3_9PLEO|nr:Nicotianamine synthase [Bimuria novae-zelandiae CBS 107.79]
MESKPPKSAPPCGRVDTPLATPPPTPSPAAATAHALHKQIQNVYSELAPLENFAPCELVNTLLTRLVTLCIQPYSAETVSQFFAIDGVKTLCSKVQAICGTAEGELERYWAEKILADAENSTGTFTNPTPLHHSNGNITDPTTTWGLLESFPYHENYKGLSHLEISLLTPFLKVSRKEDMRVVFLGSGPLPLSSLLLTTHFTTATVYNIDYEPAAISLSSALTRALGLGGRMSFACEDAFSLSPPSASGPGSRVSSEDEDGVDWDSVDVVFLAALVGLTSTEKIAVLRGLAVKLRAGTLVMCRSARGLRACLYPILELSDELLGAGFEVLAEMHPWGSVVNSVVVLRVRGEERLGCRVWEGRR